METVSTRISDKAQRLITEDRVRRIKSHIYRVQGDSGTYTVYVSYPQEVSGVCDCPAKGTCSHLIAACAYAISANAEISSDWIETVSATDPFEGLN